MSEEIKDAALVVPRSVTLAVCINGALGFTALLVTLFSLGNIEQVLNTPINYPFVQVFLDSTGSVAGATAMASIVTILGLTSGIGILATASRLCWSFCRDRGLPGWQSLQHVRVPMRVQSEIPTKFHCNDLAKPILIRNANMTEIGSG